LQRFDPLALTTMVVSREACLLRVNQMPAVKGDDREYGGRFAAAPTAVVESSRDPSWLP